MELNLFFIGTLATAAMLYMVSILLYIRWSTLNKGFYHWMYKLSGHIGGIATVTALFSILAYLLYVLYHALIK